jgi:hypothetical protein
MSYDPKMMTAPDLAAPSGRWRKLTKSDSTVLAPMPRCLVCGRGGTANLVDETGETANNFPLQTGYNPIKVMQLKTGGTADDIWGLY